MQLLASASVLFQDCLLCRDRHLRFKCEGCSFSLQFARYLTARVIAREKKASQKCRVPPGALYLGLEKCLGFLRGGTSSFGDTDNAWLAQDSHPADINSEELGDEQRKLLPESMYQSQFVWKCTVFKEHSCSLGRTTTAYTAPMLATVSVQRVP